MLVNIIDNKEFNISELKDDIEDFNNYRDYTKIMNYYELRDDSWINIDISNELFTGKIFEIQLDSKKYKISINRDLMPMKLKKAEYNDVAYKIYLKPFVLGIRKRFEYEYKEKETDENISKCNISIIRLFQII